MADVLALLIAQMPVVFSPYYFLSMHGMLPGLAPNLSKNIPKLPVLRIYYCKWLRQIGKGDYNKDDAFLWLHTDENKYMNVSGRETARG